MDNYFSTNISISEADNGFVGYEVRDGSLARSIRKVGVRYEYGEWKPFCITLIDLPERKERKL